MLHNILEVGKSHLHCGKIIISCNILCKIYTPWTSLMSCCYKSRNVKCNAKYKAMSEKQIERVVHQDSGMELNRWSYGWNAHILPIPLKYTPRFMMKNFSIIISSKRFPHTSSLYNQNIKIPQHGITVVLKKGLHIFIQLLSLWQNNQLYKNYVIFKVSIKFRELYQMPEYTGLYRQCFQ